MQISMRATHKNLLSGVTPTTPKAKCEKLLNGLPIINVRKIAG